jgi:hypothetical protein
MGQQIARNNVALPPQRAADRIAGHLKAFWTPTMVADLQAHALSHPDQLDPTLAAALRQLPSSS